MVFDRFALGACSCRPTAACNFGSLPVGRSSCLMAPSFVFSTRAPLS